MPKMEDSRGDEARWQVRDRRARYSPARSWSCAHPPWPPANCLPGNFSSAANASKAGIPADSDSPNWPASEPMIEKYPSTKWTKPGNAWAAARLNAASSWSRNSGDPGPRRLLSWARSRFKLTHSVSGWSIFAWAPCAFPAAVYCYCPNPSSRNDLPSSRETSPCSVPAHDWPPNCNLIWRRWRDRSHTMRNVPKKKPQTLFSPGEQWAWPARKRES